MALRASKPNFLSTPVVLGFFVLVVVIVRFSAFFMSTLDWDESLYLLVADQWLRGHRPYTMVWDNKPPGIYALFLVALRIFGHSVLSIRIIACAFVAATSYLIYRIGSLIEEGGWLVGLLAGCFYALMTVNNWGLAANTEIFFVFFSACGAYLVLSWNPEGSDVGKDVAWVGLAGLLLGLGFEVKQVVMFDAAPIGLILIYRILRSSSRANRTARLLLLPAALGLGFLIPFMATTALFKWVGAIDSYWYANFTANRARTLGDGFNVGAALRAVDEQCRALFLFWIGVPAAALVLFLDRRSPRAERWMLFVLLGWFLFVLGAIMAVFSNHIYSHYFSQLALPLSLLDAYVVARIVLRPAAPGRAEAKSRVGWLTLIMLVVVAQSAGKLLLQNARFVRHRWLKGDAYWSDEPAAVAAYVGARISPADYIYAVDDMPIVYFLTGAQLPTRFVFPPFLVRRTDLPNIAGIVPTEELDRILAKRPIYLIKRKSEKDPTYAASDSDFFALLDHRLDREYIHETSIGSFDIFKLRSTAP